jgi:hypothetical protein
MPILLYLFPLRFIVILKELASDMLREFCDILSNIACSFSECIQRTSGMGAVKAVGHLFLLFYVLKRSGVG